MPATWASSPIGDAPGPTAAATTGQVPTVNAPVAPMVSVAVGSSLGRLGRPGRATGADGGTGDHSSPPVGAGLCAVVTVRPRFPGPGRRLPRWWARPQG